MKILVVGSRGMLGSELMTVFQDDPGGHESVGLDLPEIDIAMPESCREAVYGLRPDVVINAAAFTRVDDCETQRELAMRVNGEGAGNLAAAAAAVDALFIHYSTDYIFDGRKTEGYREDDAPGPMSVYGKSKLLGEELVRRNSPKHMILRISWLFGANGANFIRTIVGAARKGNPLRVVSDQRGSPTYAKDVAGQTLKMTAAGCRGTYHVTNGGSCSWYDLAVQAVAWAKIPDISITPVASSEYPRPAPRPASSILVDTRMALEGLPRPRSWQDAAREYVERHLL
ncbi:MAG: dTDP-4-dehydrorhamnose reductase [Acidobacteriota bacterium]|jgi:dTDP-4-dehydrorhamnose reductase|nr:dTDP-4-dehydrorhamnose reductase [Acidobacteriota bacterium]